MKRILVIFSTLVTSIVLINSILRIYLVTPDFYTTDTAEMNQKWNLFQQHKHDVDILFIGTSRTDLHIDPKHIIVEDPIGNRLKSLNIGIRGIRFPELIHLANKSLENTDSNLKFLVIEITDVFNKYSNGKMARSDSWIKMGEMDWIFDKIDCDAPSQVYAIKYKLIYLYNLILKQFDFSFLHRKIDPDAHEKPYMKMSNHGFISLNIDALEDSLNEMMNNGSKSYINTTRRTIQKHIDLLSDTSRLTLLKNQTVNALRDTLEFRKCHTSILNRLNDLIEKGEQKGVRVIYLLPVRFHQLLKEEIPVWNKLNSCHKINMVDPDKYSEFYDLKYSFDLIHLNDRGAELYSRRLSDDFQKLILNCN